MSAEQTFEPTGQSVRLARRFVLDEVGDAPKAVLDEIAVAASELASNAVLHARTSYRVRVEREADSVRVEVTDSGGGFPEPQQQPTSDESHGRGLFIVKRLADEWGISESASDGEKSVWFRIAISERATTSP